MGAIRWTDANRRARLRLIAVSEHNFHGISFLFEWPRGYFVALVPDRDVALNPTVMTFA